jgi:hypothetical protein
VAVVVCAFLLGSALLLSAVYPPIVSAAIALGCFFGSVADSGFFRVTKKAQKAWKGQVLANSGLMILDRWGWKNYRSIICCIRCKQT